MDWTERNWVYDDRLYSPKRKVNNKASKFLNHVIGSIHSQKMKMNAEYESITECLFLYYLELDPEVIRYYVQPVEVPVVIIDPEYSAYYHIPDVLIFRNGNRPILIQIKAEEISSWDDNFGVFEQNNEACEKYARENGWEYQVIYPRKLEDELIYNLKYLSRYTKQRRIGKHLIDEILYKLKFIGPCSIQHLIDSFRAKLESVYLLPQIYYLMATGQIGFDPTLKVNLRTSIVISDERLMFNEISNIGGFEIGKKKIIEVE